MGFEFIDVDSEIECVVNMIVFEIFVMYGEFYFCSGEEWVIVCLLCEGFYVLVIGGGVFMSDVICVEIVEYGLLIWLKVEFEMVMVCVWCWLIWLFL